METCQREMLTLIILGNLCSLAFLALQSKQLRINRELAETLRFM